MWVGRESSVKHKIKRGKRQEGKCLSNFFKYNNCHDVVNKQSAKYIFYFLRRCTQLLMSDHHLISPLKLRHHVSHGMTMEGVTDQFGGNVGGGLSNSARQELSALSPCPLPP